MSKDDRNSSVLLAVDTAAEIINRVQYTLYSGGGGGHKQKTGCVSTFSSTTKREFDINVQKEHSLPLR